LGFTESANKRGSNMSDTVVHGKCLCGSVTFELTGNIGIFHNCHCSRCRKVTGAMHASNLFVSPEQISWTSGRELVKRFEAPDAKYFSTCFCSQCGSNLPWASRSGKAVIVPAGTLDDDPGIKPLSNVYFGSRAPWHVDASELPTFDEMPARK